MPDAELTAAFLADAREGHFDVEEIARARVRREAAPGVTIDAVHQAVAAGEAATVLLLFGDDAQHVPDDVIKTW